MEIKSERSMILIITTFGNFISAFMGSALNVALPHIGQEFSVDGVTLNWIPTIYVLASVVTLLSFGRLSDIVGKKRIYLTGMICMMLFTTLGALAPSFQVLLFIRVAQGISSAMIFGIGPAIITNVYPPEQRGRVIGIGAAAVYVGISTGPLIGGALIEAFGWRSIFWFGTPFLAICSVALILFVKSEWKGSEGEAFDFKGAFFYAVGMIALIFGLTKAPRIPYLLLAAAGLALLGVFIFIELKVESPLLDIRIFKSNRMFTLSNVAALVNYCATASITLLLSYYLQYIKGLSPVGAGSVMFVQPLIQTIFSPVAGKLSDKHNPGKIASIGMGFTCLGLAMLLFESFQPAMWKIFFALVVLGFGFAFFSAPNTNAIMGSVTKKELGVASAITATMRNVGQVISMAIVMFVFALVIGEVEITPVVYDKFHLSMQILLVINILMCLSAISASQARNKSVES